MIITRTAAFIQGTRPRCGACSLLAVAIALLIVNSGVRAEDAGISREEMAEMKRSQQEMMKQMKAQQERIDLLEQQVRAQKSTGAAISSGSTELSCNVANQSGRTTSSTAAAIDTKAFTIDESATRMRWNDFTVSGKSKIKLYGFLRLDAIYDDSTPSNTQTAGFIRSEDSGAPGTAGARKNNDDLTIHPRLTRLGADFLGPKIPQLGCADLTGKLEIDFYNNGLLGQAESREAVRMRHGYLKLAWPDRDVTLLAGQTSDLISPLWPIVNPDLVMWGAGNLGDRRPQLRAEWFHGMGAGKFGLQGMIGMTGADDNQDLDPAGTTGAGFRDGETSGKPTLQARGSYKRPVWEKQNLEIGLWAHRAWEEPDTLPDVAGAPYTGKTEFDSYALGLDLTVPLYRDWLWLKGEAWYGANLDDVRGGIFQGINTTLGEEIGSRGGFVEVGAKIPGMKWYSLHFGYAIDDPQNNDLNTNGRELNSTFYMAHRFNFDPIEFGLDYLNWRTQYIGLDKGHDNRFQAYISYKF